MTVLHQQVWHALKYLFLAIVWNNCTVKTKHLDLGWDVRICMWDGPGEASSTLAGESPQQQQGTEDGTIRVSS